MNNKGQSLVLFIVVIPIILFIMFLVIDIGNIYLKKEHICNLTYEAMDYKLQEKTDEEIKEYLKLNDENITVTINDNYISTSLKVKGIIKLFNLNIYEVSCTYKGNIDNNKKRIERIKQ